MNEHWIEIAVVTSQAAADVIATKLVELGSPGNAYEDHPAEPDACTIKAYYPASGNAAELVEQIRRYLDELAQLGVAIGKGEVVVNALPQTDWGSAWKQFFEPFRVGKHLVIKPSWEPFERQPADLIIEIDPGMAFGTGLHASTRLALALLEQYVQAGERVLDVGTGSGILSIAAARLGARAVLALDTDAEALTIARENVRQNGLADQIELLVGSLDTLPIAGQFDCIVMNLRPNIILQLLPYIEVILQTGGAIIAAGILAAEGAEFAREIRDFNFAVQNYAVADEWIAYVLSHVSKSEESAEFRVPSSKLTIRNS